MTRGTGLLLAMAFVVGACATGGKTLPGGYRLAAPELGLRYRVTGQGTTNLVLIHGNFDNLATWERVRPELDRNFRVLALDLPEFGESGNPFGSLSLDVMTAAVGLVMADAGMDKAVVVGNSMGGAVAASFFVRFPDKVQALVLEDSNMFPAWPLGNMGSAIQAIFAAASELQSAPQDPARMEALKKAVGDGLRIALPFPGAVDQALIDHFTAGFVGSRFDAVKNANAGLDFGPLPGKLASALAANPRPVWVVWGEKDPLIPVEVAGKIRAIPGVGPLILVGNCGHAPHLERPAEFASILTAGFGPQGKTDPGDFYLPHGDVLPEFPQFLNDQPWVEAPARAYAARKTGQPATYVQAALNLVATGRFELALGLLDEVADGAAPFIPGFKAFVRALIADKNGAAGVADLYAESHNALADSDRVWPMKRLTAFDLGPDWLTYLDGFLKPPADPEATEPLSILFMRVDLNLRRGLVATVPGDLDRVPFQLPVSFLEIRRALALLAAGRTDLARNSQRKVADEVQKARTEKRLPSEVIENLSICSENLETWIDADEGIRDSWSPDEGCEEAVYPLELDYAVVSPPRVTRIWSARSWAGRVLSEKDMDKRKARAEEARRELSGFATNPLGALTLARIALAVGDAAAAAAALDQVPAPASVQIPDFHRVRLALRIAAAKATPDALKALEEAQALAAAHPTAPEWLGVAATALFAAGRLPEAGDALARMLASGRRDEWIVELALIRLAQNRVDEATALLSGTQFGQWNWIGVTAELLPHAAGLPARLAPAGK